MKQKLEKQELVRKSYCVSIVRDLHLEFEQLEGAVRIDDMVLRMRLCQGHRRAVEALLRNLDSTLVEANQLPTLLKELHDLRVRFSQKVVHELLLRFDSSIKQLLRYQGEMVSSGSLDKAAAWSRSRT